MSILSVENLVDAIVSEDVSDSVARILARIESEKLKPMYSLDLDRPKADSSPLRFRRATRLAVTRDGSGPDYLTRAQRASGAFGPRTDHEAKAYG